MRSTQPVAHEFHYPIWDPSSPMSCPQQCPAQDRITDQRPPVVVRHSAKLTIDYESCAWVISRQEHKPPKYSLLFIYSDIQKTKIMYFFGRYKDGEPLIISDRPWNYSLQQKFGLNTLEIRRWVTSSNLQLSLGNWNECDGSVQDRARSRLLDLATDKLGME